MSLVNLPGGDLVVAGLHDLTLNRVTEEALLVSIAGPRLRRLGISVPELSGVPRPYEHALYGLLEDRMKIGAHGAYNALIQKVVSFANAYEVVKKSNPGE